MRQPRAASDQMTAPRQPPPRISVVIPVKNESAGLAACLQGVLSQTIAVEEIIVIDSGSTDGTQEIARRYPKVRLIEIPPSEFNHGDTRNLGVRAAVGEFVVFTVGDARPLADDWIEQLLGGFRDEDVVAVSGSQVVPQSKATNPVEWFRPYSRPEISIFRFDGPDAFDAADPMTKWRATSLDDVTTIYRRTALLEIPFRRVVYGEDVFFALDALAAGHALALNPAARVHHYHLENYQTVLKRTIAVASLRHQMTGYLTPGHHFAWSFLRAVLLLVRTPGLSWAERLRWSRYNWDLGRAIHDGLALVHGAARQGGDAMVLLHRTYCGTPPAPLKPATAVAKSVAVA